MRRTPRQSRFLGLWSAAWLLVLLLALLLWLGDPKLQWPALLVPVVWALLAWFRGRGSRPVRRPDDEPEPGAPDNEPEPWAPGDEAQPSPAEEPPQRPLPPTRELPWLPEVPHRREE